MTEREQTDGGVEREEEGQEPSLRPEQPSVKAARAGKRAAGARAPAEDSAAPATPSGHRGAASGVVQPPIAATVTGRRKIPARISRRAVLRLGFWAGLGAAVAGTLGITVDLVYPRGVTGFGGEVVAGPVEDFPPGGKTQITEGRFWLVHLTEQQGGPGILALWWKCPHLGCTVPWLGGFLWPDPDTGADKMGWFRCPCHGSTFTEAGLLVYGPSPRAMDTMRVRIEEGMVIVDSGDITDGGPDNPSRAVPV